MKSLVVATLVLSAFLSITVSGQVKPVAVANNPPNANSTPKQPATDAIPAREFGQDPKALTAHENVIPSASPTLQAKSDLNHSDTTRHAGTVPPANSSDRKVPSPSPEPRVVQGGAKPSEPGSAVSLQSNTAASAAAPAAVAPTQVYKVGVGDVLDIKLPDNPVRSSTLFTVLENGVLEYPFAGNPIVVAGLTAPEIAALLRQRIKIFDNPTVTVDVRDYASHAVSVRGLVAAAGTKLLRREAVPLYAILAEALVLPEGAQATITRKGCAPIVVDLQDIGLSETLVLPGDAIKVSAMPPPPTEFYFVGGEISSPGQKTYHSGLTLTQAILASGGTKTGAGSRVRISRRGVDGILSTEEFNLRRIQSGKDPDPVLRKDDRIEVTTSN